MRVGSHGWSHRDWRWIDDLEAEEELAQSHRRLTELTGRPVSRVAIPFGSYDRHVLRRLRRAGVTRAYTSDGGQARLGTWLQPRTSLVRDLDAEWTRGLLDVPPSPVLIARKLAGRTVKRVRG